jgi:cytochrome b6-f complex iron-sulfur subunit
MGQRQLGDKDDTTLDRRDFLKSVLGAGAVVGLGSTLAAVLSACDKDQAANQPSGPVVVCKQGDLKPGDTKAFKIADTPALLVANADGSFRAFSLVCTHMGCEVAWQPADKTFLCPCHGGKFNAQGQVLEGPPPSPLATYPVTVTPDGSILVG